MLMPAKSPIDSNVHCLPGVGKASSVSVEERKLEGFAGSKFVTRTRKEGTHSSVFPKSVLLRVDLELSFRFGC